MGGPPGSGTSTICRLLEKELEIQYIYAGQIFRDKARSLGLTLSEFGALCEKDPNYDKQLDTEMMELARKGDVLIEGRMSGPLCAMNSIPSFRIYMDADVKVRAGRVLERDGGDLEKVVQQMNEREKSEAQRYVDYYNIDPREAKWYDLIIDSTDLTPDEELKIILDEMKGKR